jgi:uncharacterized membrane protein YfcA
MASSSTQVAGTQLASANSRPWIDRLGIWASVACAIHCLLTPLLLSFSAVFVRLLPGEEAFHRKLAVIVASTAALALFYGFRKHRRVRVLLLMGAGLSLIIGTAWWGHLFPNHWLEVGVTICGSLLLITAHRLNHTFCKQCECVEPVCSGVPDEPHDHAGHDHSHDHSHSH